jgi:signal transduction histidine kinase
VKAPWREWPKAPLFVQLLALIGLSLVAAQAITILVFMNLPPPVPDFYRLSEVAQVFRGATPNVGERPKLVLRNVDRPPDSLLDSRLAPAIRATLAKQLGVSVERVVIGSNPGRYADRRAFRILRDRMAREGASEEHFLVAPFDVAVQSPNGQWRAVRPDPGLTLSGWQMRTALWFLLSTLAMAPVAYLFARSLSAPIRMFAEAAERIGHDPAGPPLAMRGSTEIDKAVRAFNEMQERLRRYVVYHTGMVAAVAHDLRTPLTRLRFRIESAPDDVRAKMAADIDQMEAMISTTLNYARETARTSERTPLELSSLVESVCDELAETGKSTQVALGDKVELLGDPIALRRLFANLFENALKFGGAARARVFRENASAVVEIDDDGPGIPLEDMEKVFEPYYRREPSRNRQTGGAGLGLAVVRSIARGHGGDVILINRRDGGITARVLLPI